MTANKISENKNLAALLWQKEMGVDFYNDYCVVESVSSNEVSANNQTQINNNQTIYNTDKEENVGRPKKEVAVANVANSNNDGEPVKDTLDYVAVARKLADESKTLEELRRNIENFEGLSIKKLANKCVFSDGNPNSELMLIGEAPGANEDEQGIPFCGVSGRLLDKLLKFAGFTREKNFYITNTVFWRPPGNRKPTDEEIEICKPFVEKHIALVNPKMIVLVGATATLSILNNKESISLLRKAKLKCYNPYLGKDIDCTAIFHPSYLLRQPSQKKNAWFDMLKVKKFIATSN